MICRHDLINIIQALAAEEGARQPTAAIWLKDQDEKAARPAIADEPTSGDAKDE
jgi:hypothetical protein